MANTPKAEISETEGYSEGKNSEAKTGAKYPYSAKSYHSSMLPIAPATTVFLAIGDEDVVMKVEKKTIGERRVRQRYKGERAARSIARPDVVDVRSLAHECVCHCRPAYNTSERF